MSVSGEKNSSSSESFAYVLNGWSLILLSNPLGGKSDLITDEINSGENEISWSTNDINLEENEINRSENNINSGQNEINPPENKVISDEKELDQVSIDFERVKHDFEVEQNEINQVEKNNVNLSINGFDSSNFWIGYPWRYC